MEFNKCMNEPMVDLKFDSDDKHSKLYSDTTTFIEMRYEELIALEDIEALVKEVSSLCKEYGITQKGKKKAMDSIREMYEAYTISVTHTNDTIDTIKLGCEDLMKKGLVQSYESLEHEKDLSTILLHNMIANMWGVQEASSNISSPRYKVQHFVFRMHDLIDEIKAYAKGSHQYLTSIVY